MKLFFGLLLLISSLATAPLSYAQASSTVSSSENKITLLIDGASTQSIEELHEFFATALNLPSYYGKNFDALYDVLTDEDLIPQKIDIAIFSGTALSQKIGEKKLAKLLEVINDAQENNATHIDFIYWQ